MQRRLKKFPAGILSPYPPPTGISPRTTTTNYNRAAPRQAKGLFSWLLGAKAQRDRNKAFLQAVVAGQEARVDMLFWEGVDRDYVDDTGYNALHLAANTGLLVDNLIAKGYDVNAMTPWNRSPICLAAERGHVLAVRQLIAARADVNKYDPSHKNALQEACSKGHLDVVKELVAAGACISCWSDSRSEDGDELFWIHSPLVYAIRARSVDVVRYLLENGASVRDVERGRTPLHYAVDNVRIAYGKPEFTVRNGRHEIIELLLEKGAEPTREDDDYRTPLDLADARKDTMVRNILWESLSDPRKGEVSERARKRLDGDD